MGQGHPRISVNTLCDGEDIEDVFSAMRAAVVAYGFSEETFNGHVRELAVLLALPYGK